MNPSASSPFSRRQFVGQCCRAVGATGLLSTLSSLRLMGAVASPANGPRTPPTAAAVAPDFKALVCVFLQGGNDANNMLVPTGSGYAAYAAARANLALPGGALLGLTPRTSDGRTFGLHPAMSDMQSLFSSGRMALLANVGTLVYPTNLTQYRNRSVPLPPQLFSHSDQTVQWQHSVPDRLTTTGWGGRIADLVNAFNANNQVSMSISLAGTNFFQVGSNVSQYAVSNNGAVTFDGKTGGSNALSYEAQRSALGQAHSSLLDAAFGGITSSSIANSDYLNTVLATAPALTTTFPNTTLGNQLRMVARLIAVSSTLNLKRQVFFVQLGGWDTHAAQIDAINPLAGPHSGLLGQVSQSLRSLYNATVEIGAANQVTAFTASDFGRTYRSNGEGSDHGWGNHQLIVGGAVKGGDIYGAMPDLTVNGPDDTGQGRWIPTTSVDEYAAALALWFGVSVTDLPTVLPNIGRFSRGNLGFL